MKTAIVTALLLVTVDAMTYAQQFHSIHKGLPEDATSFVGKKVAALVLTSDDALRMSAEEALVRALADRGIDAAATWRTIPREELQNKERAQQWFKQTGVEGVVVLRPIHLERRITEYAPQWTSSYYGTFWGYYGYGVTAAYTPARTEKETIVVVETMVYSIPRDKLLWGAVSDVSDPKNMDAYMKQLVKDAVKEIQKAGLIAK